MSRANNCKILVCCHKKDIMATDTPYFPIHVGKSLSDVDLGIPGDDTGENISAKNGSYCELTGMYWAWKNLKDADVVGLCHYRRYFDFHGQCRPAVPYTAFPTSSFASVDLSVPEDIIRRAFSGEVFIARPRNYRYNLMVEYCVSHVSDDFRVLRQVIKESQPAEIQEAFFQIFYQGNKLSHYNMFLMRKDLFDSYCSWLFPILDEVERRTDVSHYNSIQKRIYGYMSERLLNVWLAAYKGKVVKTPVIWFTDADEPMRYYSPAKYWLRSVMNNFSLLFLKHKNHDF